MMIPEPTERYLQALEARLQAIERYLTSQNVAWNVNLHIIPAPTIDDAPTYLWRDQRVTFVSPIQREGEALAWVKIGSAEPIIVAVCELKPMKESDT